MFDVGVESMIVYVAMIPIQWCICVFLDAITSGDNMDINKNQGQDFY